MKTMSAEEYAVINKIARKTKADCWFMVRQDKHGKDYVFDLEEVRVLSLRDGVEMLMECLDCQENYANCSFNYEEEETLKTLLNKLNIPFWKE